MVIRNRESTSMRAIQGEDIRRFRRDGFVKGPCVLPPRSLDAARRAVDAIIAGTSVGMNRVLQLRRRRGDPSSQVHVVGAWRAEPALAELAHSATIIDWVQPLMDTYAVRLFRDNVVVKPPESGGTVPWHQDYAHWAHTTPAAHITCWVALDDATTESGCLHYFEASHKGPLLPRLDDSDNFESTFERLSSLTTSAVPVEVPAGHCVFHHCMTVHGSFQNATKVIRRAAAFTYMHPETRSLERRPAIPCGSVFSEGELIEGDLFPLLSAAVPIQSAGYDRTLRPAGPSVITK